MNIQFISVYKNIKSFFLRGPILVINLINDKLIAYDFKSDKEILTVKGIYCHEIWKDYLVCTSKENSELVVLNIEGKELMKSPNLSYISKGYSNDNYFLFRGRDSDKWWFKIDPDNFSLSKEEQITNFRIFIINEVAFFWKDQSIFAHNLWDFEKNSWNLEMNDIKGFEDHHSFDFVTKPSFDEVLVLFSKKSNSLIFIDINSGKVKNILCDVNLLNIDFQAENFHVLNLKNRYIKTYDFKFLLLKEYKFIEKIQNRNAIMIKTQVHHNYIIVPTKNATMLFFDRNSKSFLHEISINKNMYISRSLSISYLIHNYNLIVRCGPNSNAPLKIFRIIQ